MKFCPCLPQKLIIKHTLTVLVLFSKNSILLTKFLPHYLITPPSDCSITILFSLSLAHLCELLSIFIKFWVTLNWEASLAHSCLHQPASVSLHSGWYSWLVWQVLTTIELTGCPDLAHTFLSLSKVYAQPSYSCTQISWTLLWPVDYATIILSGVSQSVPLRWPLLNSSNSDSSQWWALRHWLPLLPPAASMHEWGWQNAGDPLQRNFSFVTGWITFSQHVPRLWIAWGKEHVSCFPILYRMKFVFVEPNK